MLIKKPLVDWIIPTYNRIEPLRAMLSSLKSQTNSNWGAYVIIDMTAEQSMKNFPETTNLLNEDWIYNDDRFFISFMSKNHNDWGHSLREIGKQQSKADYIVMTGDDNYYTPNFVEELSKAVVNHPGMVYWDMVHSHYHYQYFKCTPAYNQIDMGAFATRTDLAKQIKLNTSYAADGEFVRDFNAKFPFEKKVKIEKVLFVHN